MNLMMMKNDEDFGDDEEDDWGDLGSENGDIPIQEQPPIIIKQQSVFRIKRR